MFPETHDENSPFQMTISLSVLDDLGIRLYSNIPAVLSEIVANAWDADATNVWIDISKEDNCIIVTDNGRGMTQDEINAKYLTVGYRKREVEPGKTPLGRSPMGRKGIGKLSVFSIANTLEIHSIKDNQKNALMMNSSDIRAIISAQRTTYKPKALSKDRIRITHGTQIILTDLKKNITSALDQHLRERLARRFSIIGHDNDFVVKLNGIEISAKERDYYHLVQFMWYLGDNRDEFVSRCKNLEQDFSYSETISVDDKDFKVKGWVGTVFESGKLDDTTNTIVIFANGKLVHEDLLKDLNETGVYASFLIGEIDANFLDADDQDDIVTSNRQSIQQDAERYIELKAFVRRLLKKIQTNWTQLRHEKGADRLIKEISPLGDWYDKLGDDQRKVAKNLLGKIESFGLPDEYSRREVVKATILAFEKLALEHQLSLLDNIETHDQFAVLQKVIGNVNELEMVHYYQIARGRVDIIRAFEKIVDDDEKEKIIQEYLFKYLWLLDPSWEMAKGSSRLEEQITTEFKKIENNLSEEERNGRVDIRYQTITGNHVIIELKRYSATVTVFTLSEQINRYKETLKKCLQAKYPNDKSDYHIECVCVLGKPPKEGIEQAKKTLASVDARFVTYDELIDRARQSYQDFLDASRKVSELNQLLSQI
jgi:hypothetical protein